MIMDDHVMEFIKNRFMCIKNLVIEVFLTAVLFSGMILTAGCDRPGDDYDMAFDYDFRETDGSWEPFFTGFNVGWEGNMELETGYRKLPEPLQIEDFAHYISAVNRSDDVKMLFRKQVEGLVPNTTYNVGYKVRFATEVPSGCAGIGGAPGEAVKVIANASKIKPEPVVGLLYEDYYVLNIQYLHDDPGIWYQNAIMGDIANSRECEDGYEYEIKEVSSGPSHDIVTTDENGRVWLLFGTRSGFEGRTELYYTFFRAEFKR
jgi:hypothetical protein